MTRSGSARPPIPEGVKRSVRQRCGFGCVVCGCPIAYQYDHIEDYVLVEAHEESNITILCATHHQSKTAGRLSKAQVERADASPFNRRGGTVKGQLSLEMVRTIQIGSNTASIRCNNSIAALLVDDKCLFGAKLVDDQFVVNLEVQSDRGAILLEIVDNEIVRSRDLGYRMGRPENYTAISEWQDRDRPSARVT